MRRIVADYPLVITALLLSLFGVAMVYSAGQTDTPTPVIRVYRSQLTWLLVGMLGAYGISRSSVRFIEWVTVPAYWLSIALLALTLVIGAGAGTAASTKSWLAIGGVRIGQPSELAKVTVVLMLAKILAARREAPKSILDLWWPALVVAIPWVIIMLQPDLGTGIVFIGIFFGVLYWSGVAWPLLLLLASPVVSLILSFSTGLWGAWFLVLLALVLYYRPYLVEGIVLMVANIATGGIAPILWEKLAPYQQNRLRVFIDPSADPRASGYHVIQSKIAIGSGGLFGKGFTLGTQKRLAFLPEQHTDFIFAVVGEEFGFLGTVGVLIVFGLVLWRLARIAERVPDPFAGIVVFGIFGAWFAHVVVNIGMTVGIMPITGIPLPFLSYGGSFLLASYLALGLVQRIAAEQGRI